MSRYRIEEGGVCYLVKSDDGKDVAIVRDKEFADEVTSILNSRDEMFTDEDNPVKDFFHAYNKFKHHYPEVKKAYVAIQYLLKQIEELKHGKES